MKRNVLSLAAVCTLAAGTAALLAATAKPAAKRKESPSAERGRALVAASGCSDCHTPKKMGPQGPEADPSRFLEGYVGDGKLAPPRLPAGWIAATNTDMTAWAGPWGISFARNLTPDEDTGIGSWSKATFIKALKTGRHMGVSRPILPPMPWTAYRNLSDRDLGAIYDYLRTIKPMHNPTPEPIPPAHAPAR